MDKDLIIQRISSASSDAFQKAVKYYSVLFSLNGIDIPDMQLNILAFTAVRGTISSGGAKEKFIEMFPTATKASIGNVVFQLRKKGFLIKRDKKIVVNPSIYLDFKRPIILQIKLNGKDT